MAPASMSKVLSDWNGLPAGEAAATILPCCGSRAWAEGVVSARPLAEADDLLAASNAVWWSLGERDWQEAFDSHPRLGEGHAKAATATSLRWSEQEQAKAEPTEALREANARYEARFHRIFLLCASGRTEPEILAALEARLGNDAVTEWREAGEQQRRITQLRLRRWLGES